MPRWSAFLLTEELAQDQPLASSSVASSYVAVENRGCSLASAQFL